MPVILDTMELEFQLLASLCHLSHYQNHSIRIGKPPRFTIQDTVSPKITLPSFTV